MGYKTAFFKFGGGGGGGTTVALTYTLREYSRTDTWTKPSNLIGIEVFVMGAGGGGGSGSVTASGQVSRAGGGGGSGNMKWGWIDASDLAATEPVVIGDGGVGGLPVSSPDTTSNAGGNGGYTYFGIDSFTLNPFFDALGGLRGEMNGGTGYGANAGNPLYYPHQTQGATGANSSISGSQGSGINRQSVFSALQYPNAAAGGGVRTTNTPYDGGAGSELLNNAMILSPQVFGGTAGGGQGGDGANNVGTFLMAGPMMVEQNLVGTIAFGTTGGGGGGSATTNGGDAGVSGSYGVGGSGGGAARNGFSSGAGQSGTGGAIKILEVTYTLV